MIREEAEKERGDCRTIKADDRVISTYHKSLNYCHVARKSMSNDNKLERRNEFCDGITADDAEDDEGEIADNQSEEEEEDAEARQINRNKKGEENEDEQDGANHPKPRISHMNFSQMKDNDRNRVCPRRMYDAPFAMYSKLSGHSLESRRDQQLVCNYNRTIPAERNGMVNYDTEMSDTTISYVDRKRNDLRDQMESCGRHDHYKVSNTDDTNRCVSETKLKIMATFDCSRKPIRCPRLDCSVNVAFSALTHHFLFDHPEVPILNVEPGVQSTLVISYEALSCNSSRCLALLLVSGKLSDSSARLFGGSQINPKYRDRLPLPVLAARLRVTDCYTCEGDVHAGGEGHCDRNIIIVWIAGLDIGDERLRCSIQVVDSFENNRFRSLMYTGPVISLRIAQSPHDVFSAGDCIVLHEGLISHITSGYTCLNVNVIVH